MTIDSGENHQYSGRVIYTKTMNILVTGAAGFIGSHVVDRLLNEGHAVIGVDNFNDYYSPVYKEENVSHLRERENGAYRLVRADITDEAAMEKIFSMEKVGLVIHLAAQAGVRMSIEHPLLYERVNVGGTTVMLECAQRHGVRDFIFASSSSVYGNQDHVPFSESDAVDHPISPYAATKRAAELIAYTYHALYGMNVVGLRFFTAYGERGRPDMSPYLFTDALLHGRSIVRFGDGSMQRDFTYIDDIVAGVIACIGKNFGYEIINLGNAQPVALSEFISTLERVCRVKAQIEERPVPAGDVAKTCADISKAKRLLDWEPHTSLEDGLTKFVSWFREHRMS